ncbi:cyclase family protein [Peribacillus cavernae]|uniref:Cyclase family protein n=1 Tax=Peribacillus cavernae TaxID=1674310 RepID=A0A3S0TRI4_9BACI|nr:cyclase family protein [Peribacillus cavernae]MDQ0221407.1 kynurenine formamidase [Peribacillus cavernae]RUQ25801.1 cyclase family protein [Peribacillus cavernae]
MGKRIIDLALKIEDNIPAHKLFQSPIYGKQWTHDFSVSLGLGVEGDPISFATSHISMLDHVGTHVDAFYHFNPKGAGIDEMPLDMFFGKAVCFDLTHIPDLGIIDVNDLEEAEAKSGLNVDGHIVLMNTGLHKRHYPNASVVQSNPGLSAEATHWLADRGSKLHGVEGPSTDAPNNSEFPSHRVCRDRGISHYEWLVNLDELVGKGEFMFYGVPLNFHGGSGSPVRAFAVLEE